MRTKNGLSKWDCAKIANFVQEKGFIGKTQVTRLYVALWDYETWANKCDEREGKAGRVIND